MRRDGRVDKKSVVMSVMIDGSVTGKLNKSVISVDIEGGMC